MEVLDKNHIRFPHPSLADEDGILAIGGDLSVSRLLLAYHYGIFPWYGEGQPIIWWSPDPRFVLKPAEVKISKSMRNYLNQKRFTVTMDTCFEKVIKNCQQIKRSDQGGTWITQEMKNAYISLHQAGFAHSVEVWLGDTLVGGLYGVALGNIFFGESMFSLENNASKYGFITLCRALEKQNFTLIDCQVPNPHVEKLGATFITRNDFLEILKDNRKQRSNPESWTSWI